MLWRLVALAAAAAAVEKVSKVDEQTGASVTAHRFAMHATSIQDPLTLTVAVINTVAVGGMTLDNSSSSIGAGAYSQYFAARIFRSRVAATPGLQRGYSEAGTLADPRRTSIGGRLLGSSGTLFVGRTPRKRSRCSRPIWL